ncbi:ABC transporter substrate-binding protein [soil metagenome]
MPTHRSTIGALALVAVLVIAAACVRDEGGDENTAAPVEEGNLPDCPLESLDGAEGPVQVELWYALGGEPQVTLEALAAEFNGSQEQVVVELQSQGESYQEVQRRYNAAIPSGQLPGIVFLEDTALPTLIDGGTILPAEACMEADGSDPGFLPSVEARNTVDGVLWPAFMNVSTPVLYYNVNHFRRAGLDPDDPPQTLDEVEEAAMALKEAGIEAPLALSLNAGFTEALVNGAGEDVVNNDNGNRGEATESAFDNPATLEVFEWHRRMDEQGLLEAVSATDGQIDQYLAVATQKSSMLIETSTAATTIKAFLGGEDVGQDDIDAGGAEVDLSALVPAATTFPGLEEPGQVKAGGGAFFLTNTGPPEVQAGAWEFMRFMQSIESQVAWHLEAGFLPITEEVAADPRVTEFWEDDLAGPMLKSGYDQLLLVDPERPGPQIGPYTEYSDAIKIALEAVVFAGTSPEDAIDEAHAEITDALANYQRANPD